MADDEPPPWARPPGDGRPAIRTIGPQRGRLLPGQAAALDALGERYVVEVATAVALIDAAADAGTPAVLDVGAGDGVSTLALAAATPDRLHVAVDVHRPGIARLVRDADAAGLANVLVVAADVWDLLLQLAPRSVADIQCCFPDPWPKTRHHRRRLVTADFVTAAARVLIGGGGLRLATDWADYAEQMRQVVRSDPDLAYLAGDDGWSPRFAGRPVTTYERRGLAAGRPPRDIRATRLP